jgi:hypothetical protein
MSLKKLEIINLDTATLEAKSRFAEAVLAVTCEKQGDDIVQREGIHLHGMSGEVVTLTCTPEHHENITTALHGTPENPTPFQVLAR